MRTAIGTAELSIAFLMCVAIASGPANSQPYPGGPSYGPGMMMGRSAMGPGMMTAPGMMMGPGMMGPGMMGPGMMGLHVHPANFNLSAADVKGYFEQWLTLRGNPHVKVGSVTETSADAIRIDIVTTDKEGLVQSYDVDRHTGVIRPG